MALIVQLEANNEEVYFGPYASTTNLKGYSLGIQDGIRHDLEIGCTIKFTNFYSGSFFTQQDLFWKDTPVFEECLQSSEDEERILINPGGQIHNPELCSYAGDWAVDPTDDTGSVLAFHLFDRSFSSILDSYQTTIWERERAMHTNTTKLYLYKDDNNNELYITNFTWGLSSTAYYYAELRSQVAGENEQLLQVFDNIVDYRFWGRQHSFSLVFNIPAGTPNITDNRITFNVFVRHDDDLEPFTTPSLNLPWANISPTAKMGVKADVNDSFDAASGGALVHFINPYSKKLLGSEVSLLSLVSLAKNRTYGCGSMVKNYATITNSPPGKVTITIADIPEVEASWYGILDIEDTYHHGYGVYTNSGVKKLGTHLRSNYSWLNGTWELYFSSCAHEPLGHRDMAFLTQGHTNILRRYLRDKFTTEQTYQVPTFGSTKYCWLLEKDGWEQLKAPDSFFAPSVQDDDEILAFLEHNNTTGQYVAMESSPRGKHEYPDPHQNILRWGKPTPGAIKLVCSIDPVIFRVNGTEKLHRLISVAIYFTEWVSNRGIKDFQTSYIDMNSWYVPSNEEGGNQDRPSGTRQPLKHRDWPVLSWDHIANDTGTVKRMAFVETGWPLLYCAYLSDEIDESSTPYSFTGIDHTWKLNGRKGAKSSENDSLSYADYPHVSERNYSKQNGFVWFPSQMEYSFGGVFTYPTNGTVDEPVDPIDHTFGTIQMQASSYPL